MLKKLRIKFIILNMAMVFVVLSAVFTAVVIFNYQQSTYTVAAALGESIESAAERQSHNADEPQNVGGTPPGIGKHDRDGEQIIPMAVFSVSEGGSVSTIDTNTALISTDVLSQATSQLTGTEDSFGTLNDLGLIYKKKVINGTTYLAFADASTASSWWYLALTLAGVGIVVMFIFFIISLFFSRWALKPVANAWSQQRRFVADASHDLKTPLTVILANTSIALEHPEKTVKSQSQWLESTQHEAKSMQHLVGDLLTLAKMDEENANIGTVTSLNAFAKNSANQHANPPEKVNMSELVEGELLQFESIAFERNISLNSNVEQGIYTEGNKQRLKRLATTLVDNACKYANENGRVDVGLKANKTHIVLTVTNTGTPIPKDDLPHLFDRFYRTDKARTSKSGGHGLGLAIASAIASEHNGNISVESSVKAGTTFTLKLPRSK